MRQLSLGHRAAGELLGPGDVLRPWEDDGEHVAYPVQSEFRVVMPLSVAILDGEITRKLMHFPEIIERLMSRVLARSRRLAGSLAIAQLTSVDTRVEVALWHLADRFGKVTRHGVLVPLPLTHETLGLVVGARRPSVTAAIGRLAERDVVQRDTEGGWLLKADPPQAIVRPPGIVG